MAVLTSTKSFYITGGTLVPDAPSYVVRPADADLYDHLYSRHFSYIFTSRQMGKSSLMVRTATRLRQEGIAVAIIDLTALGLQLAIEQWYFGLLLRVGEQLELEDSLEVYWFSHPHLSPLQRWMRALTEVVLTEITGPVVIFIDEIDLILGLPFSADEFFVGIRELYNHRSENAELLRLTFCLLGVAIPGELVSDVRITPFNIGRSIDLTDFTESEAMTLSLGMGGSRHTQTALVKRVLYWTGGQPYLTQRLCQAVTENVMLATPQDIDQICRETFLAPGSIEKEINLASVRRQLLDSSRDASELLSLYIKVRSRKRLKIDQADPLVSVLLLTGIVRLQKNCLLVRNRIYELVFDRQWVKDNLPTAAKARWTTNLKHGIATVASVAFLLFVIMSLIGYHARNARLATSPADNQSAFSVLGVGTSKAAEMPVLRQAVETEAVRPASAQAVRSHSDSLRISLLIWEMIREKNDPLLFQAYLETDPPVEFAVQAREKLNGLRALSSAPRTGVIRGQVFDANNGNPLFGAIITASNNKIDRWIVSNPEGEFFIGSISPGDYTVMIQYPGYEKKCLSSFAVKSGSITRLATASGGLQKLP